VLLVSVLVTGLDNLHFWFDADNEIARKLPTRIAAQNVTLHIFTGSLFCRGLVLAFLASGRSGGYF